MTPTERVDRAWNMTLAAREDLARAEAVRQQKQAELQRSTEELNAAIAAMQEAA